MAQRPRAAPPAEASASSGRRPHVIQRPPPNLPDRRTRDTTQTLPLGTPSRLHTTLARSLPLSGAGYGKTEEQEQNEKAGI